MTLPAKASIFAGVNLLIYVVAFPFLQFVAFFTDSYLTVGQKLIGFSLYLVPLCIVAAFLLIWKGIMRWQVWMGIFAAIYVMQAVIVGGNGRF
jgi:hypothetical protein